MTMNEILYFVAIIFSVVLSIITTITTVKKGKNTKRQIGDCNDEEPQECVNGIDKDEEIAEESFWSKLFTKIPQYIINAEQFYNQICGKASGIKTGQQKLSQVLDKIKIDCLSEDVDYDEERAKSMVNNLIELTNNVNTNK